MDTEILEGHRYLVRPVQFAQCRLIRGRRPGQADPAQVRIHIHAERLESEPRFRSIRRDQRHRADEAGNRSGHPRLESVALNSADGRCCMATLPVLPLRDEVLLPGMVVPVTLDETTQAAVDAARSTSNPQVLAVPRVDGEYGSVGVIAVI